MPVVGVQKEYLETALGEMKERYTTIDGYFSQGLGLDAATIGKLGLGLPNAADGATCGSS